MKISHWIAGSFISIYLAGWLFLVGYFLRTAINDFRKREGGYFLYEIARNLGLVKFIIAVFLGVIGVIAASILFRI